MESITAGLICSEHEEFVHLTLRSLAGVVDEIVMVGNPDEHTRRLISEGKGDTPFKLIWRNWDDNWGLARNEVLANSRGTWHLQVDCDEVLGDEGVLLSKYVDGECTNFDLEYVHFIRDFGHVDSTVERHVGINRFFRNNGVRYARRMHEFAESERFTNKGPLISKPTIFHLGYLKGVNSVHEKFKKHKEYSETHTTEFLTQWHSAHLLGSYPVKPYSGPYPWVLRTEYGCL